MLFNSFLASKTILLCFSSYFLLLLIAFYDSCKNQKCKTQTCTCHSYRYSKVQMTVANDAIEMLPVITDKTITDLSKLSKETI